MEPKRLLRPLLAFLAVGALALAMAACGDTLQVQPLSDRSVSKAVTIKIYPVYWVGRTFEGMPISTVDRDPGGAYNMTYGNCQRGGQDTCVTALQIVTSPDNSFLPGGSGARARVQIRGRSAALGQAGRAIQIATGPVVVSIFAATPSLAQQAAEAIAPINLVGAPGDPLPPPLADTGFGDSPIPSTVASGPSTTNSASAPGGVGNAVGTSH